MPSIWIIGYILCGSKVPWTFNVFATNSSQHGITLIFFDWFINLCPFRSNNVEERKKYDRLATQCRQSPQAHVHIFSSMHTSGEQLAQITGVAAILKYSIPKTWINSRINWVYCRCDLTQKVHTLLTRFRVLYAISLWIFICVVGSGVSGDKIWMKLQIYVCLREPNTRVLNTTRQVAVI